MTIDLSRFYDAGYSILPCDPQHKKPRIKSWKPLLESINRNTSFRVDDSIGLICGKVSGNIEIIDFDLKYDITGSLYSNFCEMVDAHNPDLISKLVIQKSKNGGYHFLYKCATVLKNQKLAKRPATIEEQKIGEKEKVLIETRGEGGYVVIAPSVGYEIIQGDILNLPVISQLDRDLLFACAKSFNEILEVHHHRKNVTTERFSQTGLSPFDDYNQRGDCVALLQKHGWTIVRSRKDKIFLKRPGNSESDTSGNFDNEKNWFSVFSSSTEFETEKAYLPYSVFAILECRGDFKAACFRLYNEGFGDRLESDRPKKTINEIKESNEGYIDKFWSSHINDRGKLVVTISYQLFKDWLQQEGFWRYVYGPNQYMFIRIQNNVVTQIFKKDIRKYVLDYVLSLDLAGDHANNDDVFEHIAHFESKIFSEGILEITEERELAFCKDTRTNAYYYFKNCVAVITKDAINYLQYSELPGVVWNTQIIDKELIAEGEDHNDYRTFVFNIAGQDHSRFQSICSAIGYLLHGFKDYSFCPAIILNDENISEDPEGGTGKGLFISGIKYFKKTHTIDGKSFDFGKNFKFQSISLDTQLIAFEDVKKNFHFENLFSVITEGIAVEKKNKDEFFIPFLDSPKLIITTNYTVSGEGNSNERRKVELEFRQHYNKSNTPLNEFGRLLFHDWNKDDWGRFYRFMFGCVKLYLTEGIIRQGDTNLALKHIQNDTSREFIAFASELPLNTKLDKKEIYTEFIVAYPDFSHKLLQRTFTKWLAKYAKYINAEFFETHTMKVKYFSFGKPTPETSDEIPF